MLRFVIFLLISEFDKSITANKYSVLNILLISNEVLCDEQYLKQKGIYLDP